MRQALLFAAIVGSVLVSPASLRIGEASAASTACEIPKLDPGARLDVAVVLDRSLSTLEPSGIDVDGDGRVGAIRASQMTDRDDSVLAAEVAGIRSFFEGVAGLDIRIAIVSFAGRTSVIPAETTDYFIRARDARLEHALTGNAVKLSSALDEVLERGSAGYTNFAAAIQLAVRSLAQAEFSRPSARRIALLVSDNIAPIFVETVHSIETVDPNMRLAALDAIEKKVTFHTFGFGEAARATPPHTLSRIAGATGGRYRAVKDPAELACYLMSALPRAAPAVD